MQNNIFQNINDSNEFVIMKKKFVRVLVQFICKVQACSVKHKVYVHGYVAKAWFSLTT